MLVHYSVSIYLLRAEESQWVTSTFSRKGQIEIKYCLNNIFNMFIWNSNRRIIATSTLLIIKLAIMISRGAASAASPIANSNKELPRSAQQAKELFSKLGSTKEPLLDDSKGLSLTFTDEENLTDSEALSSAENSPTSQLQKYFDDFVFEANNITAKSSIETDISQQNSQLILTCITIADLTLLAIYAIQDGKDPSSHEQLTLLRQQANALINFAASITPDDNPYGHFQAIHSGPNTRENWLRESMKNISNAFPTILINELFVTEATALADNYHSRSVSMKATALKDAKQIPVSKTDKLEYNEALQNLREKLNSQSLEIQPPTSGEKNSDEILLEIGSSQTNADGLVKDRHDLQYQIKDKCNQVFWKGNPTLQFSDLKRYRNDEADANIYKQKTKSAKTTLKS